MDNSLDHHGRNFAPNSNRPTEICLRNTTLKGGRNESNHGKMINSLKETRTINTHTHTHTHGTSKVPTAVSFTAAASSFDVSLIKLGAGVFDLPLEV